MEVQTANHTQDPSPVIEIRTRQQVAEATGQADASGNHVISILWSGRVHGHSTPLSRGDIQLVEHVLQIRVRRSKSRPNGEKGLSSPSAVTGTSAARFEQMEQYLKRACLPDSAPLFQFKNGSPLTAKAFRALLHCHLVKMGTNPQVVRHPQLPHRCSYSAAKAGSSATKIMQLGRWRSKAFQTYVQFSPTHPSAAAEMARV